MNKKWHLILSSILVFNLLLKLVYAYGYFPEINTKSTVYVLLMAYIILVGIPFAGLFSLLGLAGKKLTYVSFYFYINTAIYLIYYPKNLFYNFPPAFLALIFGMIGIGIFLYNYLKKYLNKPSLIIEMPSNTNTIKWLPYTKMNPIQYFSMGMIALGIFSALGLTLWMDTMVLVYNFKFIIER